MLSVAVKGREMSTIPSIHAQRLFMGHENNVATCVEEEGCTKTYRRGKRASKRVKKVSNLAQNLAQAVMPQKKISKPSSGPTPQKHGGVGEQR